MAATFWLILSLGTAMMHVGTFDSMDACQKAAHADWAEVLRWLEPLKTAPRRVFTTHGEPEAAAAMAEHIRERFGWRVDVPEYGQTVELE